MSSLIASGCPCAPSERSFDCLVYKVCLRRMFFVPRRSRMNSVHTGSGGEKKDGRASVRRPLCWRQGGERSKLHLRARDRTLSAEQDLPFGGISLPPQLPYRARTPAGSCLDIRQRSRIVCSSHHRRRVASLSRDLREEKGIVFRALVSTNPKCWSYTFVSKSTL